MFYNWKTPYMELTTLSESKNITTVPSVIRWSFLQLQFLSV